MYEQKNANMETSAEDIRIKGFEFNDLSIRQAFVRKVYSILLLQLLVTSGIAALFTFHEGVKLFIWKNVEIVIGCVITSFIMLLVLACCDNVRRKHPMNLICLSIFTIVEAVLVGFVCSANNENQVLIAVGITAVICFFLTVFAFQTKYDFTGWGPYLFTFFIGLLLFGLLIAFIPDRKLNLVYGALGAVLFSFILIYDTQIMLGGNHKYTISPEEHIFAALNLYLDIISIFLRILRLLQ